MPELPEVETTRRGIQPHIINHQIQDIRIHQPRLRWPIPNNLASCCVGQYVEAVTRRAKYLLIHLQSHSILIHLGMSGSLRIADSAGLRQKHDHAEIILSANIRLLFNDPRRFGCILLSTRQQLEQHKLLANLGPEPLTNDFDGSYLFSLAKGSKKQSKSKARSAPVKSFIMDQRIVVGVGNIYANEALFNSGISPVRRAGNISKKRFETLAFATKDILSNAINMGGTTLRDFVGGDGKPGYFQQTLMVYGRGGKPCQHCGKALKEIKLNQRSTVYCQTCQR